MNPESRGVDVWLLRSAEWTALAMLLIAIGPIARGGGVLRVDGAELPL
jgi:hypothetical protein